MPEAADSGSPYLADWARPDDLDALAQLQAHLWCPDPSLNRARLRWKYGLDRGPSDETRIAVVRHGSRPVGMRGFLRQTWEVDGKAYPVFVSDDLVVAPEHRGKGLFGRLNAVAYPALARANARFVLSTSPLAVTRRLLTAEGAVAVGPFGPVGRMAASARLRDAAATALGRVPFLWRWASRMPQGAGATHAFARLSAMNGGEVAITEAPWPDAMAALVARLPNDGRVSMRRDRSFFAARFDDPLHEYRFLYAGPQDRLAGYLVLERSRSAFASARRVHIADWEAADEEAAKRLLAPVLDGGAFAELITWADGLAPACAEAARAADFRPVDAHLVRRGQPAYLLMPLPGTSRQSIRLGTRDLTAQANWAPRLIYTSYV